MPTINKFKNLFELEDGITYLNCANVSPLLKAEKAAGLESIERRAKPWGLSAKEWFGFVEKVRSRAAVIFQTSDNNIAFVPSVSFGLALAAKNFKVKTGQQIILIEDQFPSHVYIWQELAKKFGLEIITIKRHNDRVLTEDILEAINSKTIIVAIWQCQWVDGALIDLKKISEAVKASGAYLVLDLSQSTGVLPLDIDQIDPDFAVTVGYKWLLGPYGLGYMYVSPRWHKIGEPLEYNWSPRKGSDDFTKLTTYRPEYRDGARKFDMGEFSQFNAMQAVVSLDQIIEWGVTNIHSGIKKLVDHISTRLLENTTYRAPLTPNAGHMIAIPIPAGIKDKESLENILDENKIFVSVRGSDIRVSPHLYNNIEDIDKLFDCLNTLKATR